MLPFYHLGSLIRCECQRPHIEGQFRCSGSESYLSWLDYAMGIDGDLDTGWREDYEFEICDSPDEMEAKLAAKKRDGDTARMVAGFCWP